MNLHPGRPGLVFAQDGRVRVVISRPQLRLLLALERRIEPLPVRQATRSIWPEQAGPLTASKRASAARSITRLTKRSFIAQAQSGQPVSLTEMGMRLLENRRPLIDEVMKIPEPA